MGEFCDGVEAEGVQAIPHEVLDGLHIVPRLRLESGQLVDLVLTEVGDQRAQPRDLLVGQR